MLSIYWRNFLFQLCYNKTVKNMFELENGKYYSLGQKTFLLFIMQRSGAAIFLLIIAILINTIPALALSLGSNIISILNVITGVIILLAIIVEIFGIVVTRLEYGVSKVMLDDASLRIIRGILSKEELELPYRRIQSVEIKQTLFQRWFGVGRVVISTTTDLDQPSQSGNEADDEVIPLMDYPLAQAIADTLADRAEIEKMQIQQKIPTSQK